MTIAQRLAAKRINECAVACPDCNDDIQIESHGWAFSAKAQETPIVEGVACERCDYYVEQYDARALVAAAKALDAETRVWLQEYSRAMELLRAEIQRDQVIATCLGTFYTVRFLPYAGRNPRTGELVDVPEKRRRAFVPSNELIAACELPPPRKLTRADLNDEDIVRRYTDDAAADEEGATPATPAPTRSVDLTVAMDVLSAELVATGLSRVGDVGTLARLREHDDEQLFTVVRIRFRRLLEPEFCEQR